LKTGYPDYKCHSHASLAGINALAFNNPYLSIKAMKAGNSLRLLPYQIQFLHRLLAEFEIGMLI